MRELARAMWQMFFIIVTGAVAAAAVFCAIFYPGGTFEIGIMWQLLLSSLLCTLTYLVFYARRELSRRQLLLRKALHLALLLLILVGSAIGFGWLRPTSALELCVFVLLVVVVYVLVNLMLALNDKWQAQRLNEGLQRYKKR